MDNIQVVPTPPESQEAPPPGWLSPLNQIIWGLALSTVTLDIPVVQELTSYLGPILLLLGFRAIRTENRWMNLCYALTVVRCVLLVPLFALNATILRNRFYASDLGVLVSAAIMLLTFVTLGSWWRGLRQLRQAAKLQASTRAAGGLLVWFVVVALLSLVPVIGIFVFLVLLVLYVLAISRMFRFAKAVAHSGYPLPPVSVRCSDRTVLLSITACVLVGIAGGYLFVHSYPMDWAVFPEPPESAQTEEIKENLQNLGFPSSILDDLSQTDLLDCQEAQQVVVDEYTDSFEEHTTSDGVVPSLRLTGIGIKLSGQPERWKLIHHFQWVDCPDFYGTESFQLTPADADTPYWTSVEDPVHGRLLYDRDGVSFTAPYYDLKETSYRYDTVFWGQQSKNDWFAAFSLPNRGENHRGYLAYSILSTQETGDILVDSWIQYTHQTSRFQYPVRTATEYQQQGQYGHGRPFSTVQVGLSFGTGVQSE